MANQVNVEQRKMIKVSAWNVHSSNILKTAVTDLLFALDDGQSFSHQFLVDATQVGHFLLAFVMNVHAAFCTGDTVYHAITPETQETIVFNKPHSSDSVFLLMRKAFLLIFPADIVTHRFLKKEDVKS